jgi:hypothetical protein
LVNDRLACDLFLAAQLLTKIEWLELFDFGQ